jgi:hypothetical protein
MKTKGGKLMNPADAFRKEQRKREIKRNKAERQYIRDAGSKKDDPSVLRAELEQLIALEQTTEGLNRLQKLRKKVVLEAYEAAVRRKKVGVQPPAAASQVLLLHVLVAVHKWDLVLQVCFTAAVVAMARGMHV